MTIGEAKKEYNKLLKRFEDANKYFDRTDISQEKKEKFLDAFKQILKGLNYYLAKIEIYTEQEVLEALSMENNPMKIIYEHFGREKEDDQDILSIANIFYEMGEKEQEEKNENTEHSRLM